MPRHNSNVSYVEPNYAANDWKVEDDYERSPRLEDMCVMFNIEVEVFGRDNIINGETTQKDVIILSCRLNGSSSASTVNFLGGTKINCNDKDSSYMRYVTTNYADMYVGDLVNYGTTEMIGVKSVDIEYQKSCVPIITIQFTDVRGMSLFQPTELGRSDIYDGIRGLNIDNVAQTFFQCFFKLPSPKYTIYMKGFYGKPVCYEVMCDKFDTKFNSSTGDFDITARFIGYNYSFLTDVSMDALIAAPYSDYLGNQYWKDEIASGRFTIKGKDGVSEVPMPTLIEIRNKVAIALKKVPPTDSPLDAEDKYHTEEIEKLNTLKTMFQSWYASLYNALSEKYTENFCYLFKRSGNADNFYRILILTNDPLNESGYTLNNIYEKLGNDFKKLNNDLFSAIENYNSDTDRPHATITNVSNDFSDYKVEPLFNKMYMDNQGKVVFNGFDKNCKLGYSSVVNKVFYGVDYRNEDNMIEKRQQHKDFILDKIYNDGINQYINCYCIEVPYDSLQSRISALQSEANQDPKDKENKARIKQLNNELINEIKWYPTVENFTKIMMAHMETLMYMMYKTVDSAHGRKVSELNVTVGSNGNCPDINSNSDTVPPFPRVTREVIGSDGIVKKEDEWVGNVSQLFVETDFVNGLFNGIDRANSLIQAANISIQNLQKKLDDQANPSNASDNIIKYPLTPFDLFIKKSPYGNNDEIMNDSSGNKFMGRVAMRMFAILRLNKLMGITSGFANADGIKKIARTEAENFNSSNAATNDTFIELVRGGTLNGDTFIRKITTPNNSNPWGNVALINNENKLTAYKLNHGGTYVWPIQNESYSSIRESVSKLNNGNFIFSDSYTDGPSSGTTYQKYSQATYGLGGCAILDDFQSIKTIMNNASSNSIEDYQGVYNSLVSHGFDDTVDNAILNDTSSGFASWQDDRTALKYIYGYDNRLNFDKSKSFLYTSTKSYGFRKRIIIDGFGLTPNQEKIARIIMCISGGSLWDTIFKNNSFQNKIFAHIHRLNVLKIGALICASGTIFWKKDSDYYFNYIKERLPINNGYSKSTIGGLIPLQAKVRAEFAKYFINWSKTEIAGKLLKIATESKYYVSGGNLNKSSGTVVDVSKNLISEVVCVQFTSFLSQTDYIRQNMYKTYFESFIERLKETYTRNDNSNNNENNTPQENSIGGLINGTVASPNKCNEDMKKGLYMYLKLVYDKWVPSSSFDKWKIENYFEEYNTDENIGDKFYFIDSYYNKIGQKLLINPEKLYEKIDALMSYQDVNVMMLGFMADIYSQNKCMLMAIQNFADISKKDSMNELFKPLPYNSIDWSTVNRHPSFVVVYPYEPSKHLNVANSEYNDDSFMLNDENETPIAIRSRNGNGTYCIPAFGVTYGRQYQSYFKNVDIGTQTPVATQQSIKAKHYILRDSNGAKNAVGAVAQDLYDIYSTQSYTCNVTMMGCAWIQPMMYFVLLNVPMFRGSYLIMKVKHSLRPGDMVTTFTGCRMASVSNPLVEDIFTDDSYGGGSNGGATKERLADVDNDCPYKVYSLFQDSYEDFEYTFPQDDSKESFAKTMFCAYKKSDSSLNDELVISLVSQDCQESTWGKSDAARYFNYGGIHAYGSQRSEGHALHRYNSIDDYVRGKETACLRKYPNWKNATTLEAYIRAIQESEHPPYAGDQNYLEHVRAHYSQVKNYVSSLISSSNSNALNRQNNNYTNEDIANALFEALQKSVNSTPSANVELKKSYNSNKNILIISQKNNNRDRLGNVFDILLNGYSDYIKELYWVYDSSNGNTGDPLHIDVIAEQSPNASQRKIYVCETNNIENSKSREVGNDANKKLRLALYKKYRGVNRDVPQVRSNDTYKDLSLADCDELLRSATIGNVASGNGSIRQKMIELFGESWNSRTEHKSAEWVSQFLKTVTLKCRRRSHGPLEEIKVKFHKKLEGNLQSIFNELAEHEEFYVKSWSAYRDSNIAHSSTQSNHAYGVAFDLNIYENPRFYNNGTTEPPEGVNFNDPILSMKDNSNWIVKIWAKYGFGWGGNYRQEKDYMHFSYFNGW